MGRVVMKVLLVVLAISGMTRARSAATYDQRQEGKVNVQIDVKDVQIVALVDSEMLDDYTNYDYAYDYADFTIKPSSRPTTGKPPSTASGAIPSTNSSTSSGNEESWSTWPTNPTSSASPSSADSSTPESSSPSSGESSSTKAPEVSSTVSTSVPADESLPATIAVALVHHNPSEDENKKIVEGVSNASKLEAEKQQQIQSELSTSTTTAAAAAAAADETKPDGSKRPAGIAEPRKRCPVGFLLKSGKCFKRRYSLISPRLALMKLAPALLSKSNLLSGIPAAAAVAAAAPAPSS